MFTELKPYPELAAHDGVHSDVVPRHWTWHRIKSLAKLNPSRSEAREDIASGAEATFLPMEAVSSLGRVDYSRRIDPSMSAAGFTYFREGDVLVAKITPCFENGKGACLEELPTSFGLGSTEFHVLRAGTEIDPKFLEAVTRTWRFRRLGADAMTGSAGQQRVPPEFVSSYAVALPPRAEQEQIVRFLSHANAGIDRAIAAKRKMIGLLKEQERAIVTQGVTSAYESNASSRYSGFSWLGNIPSGWAVMRAKRLFREVDERSTTGLEEKLSVSHLTGVSPRRLKNVTMFHPTSYVGHKLCRPDDLVVNTMWAWMGALGVAKVEGVVSPAYAVYRARVPDLVVPQYADFLLRSATYVANYKSRSTGIRPSRLRLYPDQFLATPVLVPPVREQICLVRSIRAAILGVERTAERCHGEVGLLQEFRTRLTSDVVTGQLDVREVASKLPDLDPADLACTEFNDSDDIDAVAEEFLDEDAL